MDQVKEVKDLGHILEAELARLVDSFGRAGVRSLHDSLASAPGWLVTPFQTMEEREGLGAPWSSGDLMLACE